MPKITVAPGVELTRKQKDFADAYLEHGNGAKAARQAGYSPIAAKERAAENVTKSNVLAYLEQEGYAKAAREITDEQVKGMFVELAVDGKLEATKMRAREGLARVHGMFIDRHEIVTRQGPEAVLIAMVENGRPRAEIDAFCARCGLSPPDRLQDITPSSDGHDS